MSIVHLGSCQVPRMYMLHVLFVSYVNVICISTSHDLLSLAHLHPQYLKCVVVFKIWMVVFKIWMFCLTTMSSLAPFCSFLFNIPLQEFTRLAKTWTAADRPWLPADPETTSATTLSESPCARVSHLFYLLFLILCDIISI